MQSHMKFSCEDFFKLSPPARPKGGMSWAQARFQACELCATALHSSVRERGCKDSHLDQSCLAHQLKETGCLFQLLAP